MIFGLTTKICEGNIGAAAFVGQVLTIDPINGIKALNRMYYNNIRGDKLYMLWNDCCINDTEKAINIMLNNTIKDIKEHINYKNGRGIEYA